MVNPALYKKTVDILFQAYFNDTLQLGNCYACAVGNIIAANKGWKYLVDNTTDLKYYWESEPVNVYAVFGRPVDHLWLKAIRGGSVCGVAINPAIIDQVTATGYSFRELSVIEHAFENATDWGLSEDENMFNGLVAVLEVLKDIHQVEDNEPDVIRFRDQYTNRTCKAL